MFRGLFVLMAVTTVAMAAVAILPLQEKPEEFKDVPGCYIPELNEVIPVDARKPSKTECKEYHCTEQNVQIFTCGAILVKPPCTLVPSDSSLPYPDCCAKAACPPVESQPPPTTDCE